MKEAFVIISFALILIEDVRHRGVHWVLFPVLLTAVLIFSFDSLSTREVSLNIGFVLFILSSLSLYLSLKHRKWVNITKGFFSLGDILFLLILIPLFSFEQYVVFFTFGTMVSLVLHLVISLFTEQKTVPYAGYMALLGLITIVFRSSFIQLTSLI